MTRAGYKDSQTLLYSVGTLMFEWHVWKSGSNVEKHGVRFEEASSAFGDELGVYVRDVAHSSDEDRWLLIARSEAGKLLTVIYVDRGERYRLISARPATPKEKRAYDRTGRAGF